MNRRSFFGILAAGLAAAADPERLLWAPGRKLISIPKRSSYKIGDQIQVRRPIRFTARQGPSFHPIQLIDPDAPWVILTQEMSREEFKRRYP